MTNASLFNPNANGFLNIKVCLYSGDIKVECTSPEGPVDSESSIWNPVEETEENNDTTYTGFLPEETSQPPAEPAETELSEYDAAEKNNWGMFYLISKKMIEHFMYLHRFSS